MTNTGKLKERNLFLYFDHIVPAVYKVETLSLGTGAVREF